MEKYKNLNEKLTEDTPLNKRVVAEKRICELDRSIKITYWKTKRKGKEEK